MMGVTRRWLAGLSIAVVSAGCSSGSGPDRESRSEDVVRSIDARKAEVLEVGTDLKLVAELPNRRGKRHVYYSGFTEDGKVLGSMAEPEPPSESIPGPPVEKQTYPFIYDLDTETFTILDEADRPEPTLTDGLMSFGDTIVWIEAHGHSMGPDGFTVRSYDRATGTARDLATFANPRRTGIYGYDLAVHEGIVYFNAPISTSAKKDTPAVFSVPMDGTEPAKPVTEGMGVELHGDDLTYEDGATRYTRDLTTGSTSEAWTSSHADEQGFCDATRTETFETWCLGTPVDDPDLEDAVTDPALTIKERSGRTAVLQGFASDGNHPVPQDIESYGSWISFVVSGGDWPAPQYLVDIDSGALRKLPTDHMLGPVSSHGGRAILNEVVGKGGAPQRIVEIPEP